MARDGDFPKERPVLIRLEGLTKIFGEGDAAVGALRGIDLVIRDGEFVAIMGPSGSGKSTSMNILGCLDVPTGGRYLFRGVDVGALDNDQRALVRRHYLGFVFQGYNLLPRTSALENVELPLIYRGVPAGERRRLAARGARRRRSDRWERHSSERALRRPAAARRHRPRDRHRAGGPPRRRADRQSRYARAARRSWGCSPALNRDKGITIIMVTHEPDMAAYAGRVIRFKDGLVESDDRERQGRLMLLETITLAFRAIRRSALRSVLTILGVVIGVAAVIAMVTLGSGTTAKVVADISRLGSNLLAVRPGQGPGPGGPGGGGKTFNIADAAAIARGDRRRQVGRAGGIEADHRDRRQRELDDDVDRHRRRLFRDASVGPCRGAPVHRQRAARRQRRVHHRRDGAQEPLRRRRSARPDRAPAEDLLRGHRAPRDQGPGQLRPGPGRCRADAAPRLSAALRRQQPTST